MNTIQKTIVPENKRPDFLPSKLPTGFMQFESLAYAVADKLCESYSGGYWEFVDLSNGGFFMYPQISDNGKLTISCDNYFEGELDEEVAGIVFTLYAVSSIDHDMYHLLLDYAQTLPSEVRQQIFAAID